MKMKCKKIKDLVFAYQDGQLAELEKAEFERHLRACPACSARLEEIRKIDGLLRTAAAAAVPGADFDKSWRKIAVLGIVVARLSFSPSRTEMAASVETPFLYSTREYFAALQPVLSEFINAPSQNNSNTTDQARVRLLLNNLHLLRLRADRNKDSSLLRLLDDIELVLLEIVHLDRSDPENTRQVGSLIQEKGITMKMKVFKFTDRKTVSI
jgi:hypothetical protein